MVNWKKTFEPLREKSNYVVSNQVRHKPVLQQTNIYEPCHEKLTFCICENKGTDQLWLISAFVFATQIVPFLHFLNPKFPISSNILWLYSSVCVGPVCKPNYRFAHKMAHVYQLWSFTEMLTGLFKQCRIRAQTVERAVISGNLLYIFMFDTF